jgi:chromosome partitioning protein
MNRFPRSLVAASGKGGVGKTTVISNLAAIAARDGDEVVLVDLDPQANLANEFDIEDHDGGKSLLAAGMEILERPVLHPTGRDRLSYVAAGDSTSELFEYALISGRGDPTKMARMVHRALMPIYEERKPRFFFDTPPSAGSSPADAGLLLGEWVVIPSRTDRNSLDGVAAMLRRILTNAPDPDDLIKVAGVVLFEINPQATSMNADTRSELSEDLDGAFRIFDAMIRHADKAQRQAKEVGMVAAEYADLAHSAEPWFEAVKRGEAPVSFASNADSLAGDYERLAAECFALMEQS